MAGIRVPRRHKKLRIIATDRPGIGLSSMHPNRTLGDFAYDALELADHLSLKRFAVFGSSGGGPYALACARFIPAERLSAVGVFAGTPPDFYEQGRTPEECEYLIWWMGDQIRRQIQEPDVDYDLFDAEEITRECLIIRFQRTKTLLEDNGDGSLTEDMMKMIQNVIDQGRLPSVASFPEDFSRAVAATGKVGADDFEALQVALQSASRLEALHRDPLQMGKSRKQNALEKNEAYRQGARGQIQEAKLTNKAEWDFKLEEIKFPGIRIWHGDADRNCSVRSVRLMKDRVKDCMYREFPGESHSSLADFLRVIVDEFNPDVPEPVHPLPEKLGSLRLADTDFETDRERRLKRRNLAREDQ